MIKSGIKHLIFLLLPFVGLSQNATYVGIEVGPKFEIYQSVDNGDRLSTKPFFFNPIYGFVLGQELSNVFAVETGFFVNNYGESYRVEGDDFGTVAYSAIIAFQIPLRLKARMSLVRNTLSLTSTVGYTIAINNDYGSSGSGSSSIDFNNNSVSSNHTSNYSLQKTYGLIEAGLGLDYRFKNSLRLSLAANYLAGLSKVIEVDVMYRVNSEPEQQGTVFSNGDYFSLVFGVKYPISNFWRKAGE